MPGNTGSLTRSHLAARGPRYVLRQVVRYRRGAIGKVIYREGETPFGPHRKSYTVIMARSFRLRYLLWIARGRKRVQLARSANLSMKHPKGCGKERPCPAAC